MSLMDGLVCKVIAINEVGKQTIAFVVLVNSTIQLFGSIDPLSELRKVLFIQSLV